MNWMEMTTRGGQVKVWDVNSVNESQFTTKLYSDKVSSLQWHPSGELLCCGLQSSLYQVIDPRLATSVCEWIVGNEFDLFLYSLIYSYIHIFIWETFNIFSIIYCD